MQIERATSKNILEVMYLLQHCIKDFNDKSIYQWNLSYPDYNKVLDEIKSDSLFVAKINGVCVATITLNEQQEAAFENVNWHNKTNKFLVIHRLAVFPSWQKKGIGRKLIEFAEELALKNNLKSIRLDISDSCKYLISLYETFGYNHTGDILYPKQKESFKCLEKVI